MYDNGYPCKNHILRDCTFEDGAGEDSVKWADSKADHDFTVEWTVKVTSAPGAEVQILDKNGREVFSGATNAEGELEAPLAHYKATPTGREMATPHTFMIRKGDKEKRQQVMMDKPRSIEVSL